MSIESYKAKAVTVYLFPLGKLVLCSEKKVRRLKAEALVTNWIEDPFEERGFNQRESSI